jgi:hypothetical protein
MSVDQITATIASWARQEHQTRPSLDRRNQLAREFMANEGDDPKKQADRLFRLAVYMQREATRVRRDRREELALAAA